jgi:hypothetical protein
VLLLVIDSLTLVDAQYGARQGVVEQLVDEGPGLEASEAWRCSHALSAAAASSSELRPCARLLVNAANEPFVFPRGPQCCAQSKYIRQVRANFARDVEYILQEISDDTGAMKR